MTKMIFGKALPFLLALSLCCMAFSSCDKDNNIKNGPGQQVNYSGELISKGVCNAFGVSSEAAMMNYVAETGIYYIDCFYNGVGSFGFTWDQKTNNLSLIDFPTGLHNGFYPIDFLSQKDYEAEMGDRAEPSFYDPEKDVFTFNVLYETAIDDGVLVHNTTTITYKPKKEDS